jgi:PEP-CTERM motif
MTRPSVALLASAVTSLLFAGGQARADFIEWSYNWAPSVTAVLSDTSVTSSLKLSNEPGATASGNSDIVATNITAMSDAPRGTPDTFDSNGNFSLKLHLTDLASGQATDLTFGAKFSGPLSSQSANVVVNFLSPTEYQVQLGNSLYHVMIGPYSPPGPPSQANNKGSIAATVTVDPTNVRKAPEPGTLALSGIGLSFLGLASWRRRRRKVAVLARA